jgi:hypothetical protein
MEVEHRSPPLKLQETNGRYFLCAENAYQFFLMISHIDALLSTISWALKYVGVFV